MADLTRRQFLTGTAALAAGVAISRPIDALARMGGGMGGGGTVTPPAVGKAFADPPILPNLSAVPGVVEVSLDARVAPVDVNGVRASLMTYNGLFPGGTIRARRGDLLRVRFSNGLPMSTATNLIGFPRYTTNLHTHGLHVHPGKNMNGTHGDDMSVVVEPGGSLVYEYDLSKQHPGTLNFYHPHVHGNAAEQMWAGLSGALAIEDEVTTLSSYETHVMVLKDITLSGGAPAPHGSMMDYMHGKEGSTVMVNGSVNPLLTIKPGQVQRWRIVNSCTARFFRLALKNHTMHLVGTDGGLLDRPYPVSELLVSPGERVDILVKADQPAASYQFVSLPYSRMGRMSSSQVTLLTMSYGGGPVSDALPTTVDPAAHRVTMDTSMLPKKTITLTMGSGSGYINGVKFVDHDHCYTAMSHLGSWEVWEVVNPTNMDHPFHHHVNSAQVLSITGGDASYASLYTTAPAWKDVTIVPKGGRIRLLMPVHDYAGMAMLHCHIIEHEDIGMMAAWHIMGDGMPM